MSDKKIIEPVDGDDKEEHFSDDVAVHRTKRQIDAELARDIASEVAEWGGGDYMADGESYDPDWY